MSNLCAYLERWPGIIAAALLVLAPAAALAQGTPPREHDKPREMENTHWFTKTPRRDTPLQNFRFEVKVTGGDRLLWAGDLYLSEYEGARFETDLQDINPACSYEERRKVSRNSALVLTLKSFDTTDSYSFWLRTYWEHRLPQCGEVRSAIAWLSVPVEIAEGETRTLEGDSGLRVQLTRRPWPE
ncbi:hypothetical protein [Erythrobacter donghaensis]|uniref:hypothetical protein n=1 Tax=Erythrobacter donghaensis TaxID=267135 RepID=UPI001180E04E|nr:hypothetical protein [Erythrobacter donghaensis]